MLPPLLRLPCRLLRTAPPAGVQLQATQRFLGTALAAAAGAAAALGAEGAAGGRAAAQHVVGAGWLALASVANQVRTVSAICKCLCVMAVEGTSTGLEPTLQACQTSHSTWRAMHGCHRRSRLIELNLRGLQVQAQAAALRRAAEGHLPTTAAPLGDEEAPQLLEVSAAHALGQGSHGLRQFSMR